MTTIPIDDELLAMPDVAEFDFEPSHLTNFYPADLS